MNLITKSSLLASLGLAILASYTAIAQNAARPNRYLPAGANSAATAPANVDASSEGERPARPVPPLVAALDANKDGELDASEIANASAALKSLDKNGDGKLTVDELRPARPNGGRGPGRGHGPGGARGGHHAPPAPADTASE